MSISELRQSLPSIMKETAETREEVTVLRHGKPIARILPWTRAQDDDEACYPLRGRPVRMDDDFDAYPIHEVWEALKVAERKTDNGKPS